MKKYLYIIAGCNGAGKTTASYTILPDILKVREFVNADEIAKGLSPFQPEKVAFESGRIMLRRIEELLTQSGSFAFETTLATRSYAGKIRIAQQAGFHVILLFFWLRDVRLAIERVRIRVMEGGHNIEKHVIKRRYRNGLKNFFEIYQPLVNEWMIIDNSEGQFDLVATGMAGNPPFVIGEKKYNLLTSYYVSLIEEKP
ncbi:MAG: zeta toxin family protein [Saprospiraceae bacterium]|nr:zeta toxin family protein [Saprospiraceae bacterium]